MRKHNVLAGLVAVAFLYAGVTSASAQPVVVVEKNPLVYAQNIVANLPDQPLGGFIVTVEGEPLLVARTTFHVSGWEGTAGSLSHQDITDVKLIDENGTVLAGPVAIESSSSDVTFRNVIVYPMGTTYVTLVGKLGLDYGNNDIISVSTKPDEDWQRAVGAGSGEEAFITSATVTANTMFVKKAALKISVSGTPVSQTILSLVGNFTFATYILDAAQSGENVLIGSLQAEYNVWSGDPTDLTNCALYDGATPITTGSHVVNPIAGGPSIEFFLDSPMTIQKATIKVLSLKCDIDPNTNGVYSWGYDESSTLSAMGGISRAPATIVEYDNPGQKITIISL